MIRGANTRVLGRFPVRMDVDVRAARRAVRCFAEQVGFGRIQSEELTIVASELCTNIVKYGIRGTLAVEQVSHPLHGTGLVLEARDEGPPFHDFELAVRDRSDDRGTIPPEKLSGRSGIGAGLGAVRRLTHRLWLEEHGGGKSVMALRYLRRPTSL